MKKQNKTVQPETLVEETNIIVQPVAVETVTNQNGDKTYITECVLAGENVKETEKIIEKIQSFHNQVRTSTLAYNEAAGNMVKAAIEAGKLLLAEKHRRGKTFMLWVECYMTFGYETAGRYMRLAKSSHVTTKDKDGNVIKLDEAKSIRAAYMMADIIKPKPQPSQAQLAAYIYIKKLMEVLPTYNDDQKKELMVYLDKLVEWVTLTKQELALVYDDTIKLPTIDLNAQKEVVA